MVPTSSVAHDYDAHVYECSIRHTLPDMIDRSRCASSDSSLCLPAKTR